MNREQIIKMAREAGLLPSWSIPFTDSEKIERFAALVAAHEREQCAKEADYYASNSITAKQIAAAIRARGQQ